MEKVSPSSLVQVLGVSSVFARGLPYDTALQTPDFTSVFETILLSGLVTDHTFTDDNNKAAALKECYLKGWLHTDKLYESGEPGEVGYYFASPLHRWYVEWKLWGINPSMPFPITDILEFVVTIIRLFSRQFLASQRQIGPHFIQNPPEAQYQHEFYRCCHSYWKGCLVALPEYGTPKGRVDFYIPSKQWGVELLHDGSMLEGHCSRFSSSGSYGTTLALSDYIILDCLKKRPVKRHAGRHSLFHCFFKSFDSLTISSDTDIPKLYHVVFDESSHAVSILDHQLKLVSGGEFVLLQS